VGHPQVLLSSYEEAIAVSPAAKILIMTDQADELIEKAKSQLPSDLSIIRGSPYPFFVEFLRDKVTKGAALVQVCERISIPCNQVIAFGDGDNDKEMLELMGYSCAPSNAKEVAKQAAKKVLSVRVLFSVIVLLWFPLSF
jgi:hydroxymethylpyrimidine pyrophosphatase-like HAD family hydrolase